MEIKILHLYHDLMNLYGDYGNVKILAHHLKDIGVTTIVEEKTIGDSFNLLDYDFIYCGSGTENNLKLAMQDLKSHTKELQEYIKQNKYALFTGCSFEMLGKSIDDEPALDILDFEVNRLNDRITSDVIMESEYFSNKVVGFINKMGMIENNKYPLFHVIFGIGESDKTKNEGIKFYNLYGTYITGPILVRNPEMLQKFVEGICNNKDSNFKFEPKEYENEEAGYNLVLEELSKRTI